jgi:hypothetical protein
LPARPELTESGPWSDFATRPHPTTPHPRSGDSA